MNHRRNRNSGERLPLLRPVSALNWSIFSIRSAIWCNGDAIRSDSTVLISGDGSRLVSLFHSPIGCWHRDYDLALGNWTSLSVMGFAMCSYVVFSVRNSLIPLKVMAFFSAAVYVWRCLSTSWNTWSSSIGCCCHHFRFRFCWSFSFVLFFVGGLMEFPQFTLQAWIYPILKWPVLALACSVFVGAELMRNHL